MLKIEKDKRIELKRKLEGAWEKMRWVTKILEEDIIMKSKEERKEIMIRMESESKRLELRKCNRKEKFKVELKLVRDRIEIDAILEETEPLHDDDQLDTMRLSIENLSETLDVTEPVRMSNHTNLSIEDAKDDLDEIEVFAKILDGDCDDLEIPVPTQAGNPGCAASGGYSEGSCDGWGGACTPPVPTWIMPQPHRSLEMIITLESLEKRIWSLEVMDEIMGKVVERSREIELKSAQKEVNELKIKISKLETKRKIVILSETLAKLRMPNDTVKMTPRNGRGGL